MPEPQIAKQCMITEHVQRAIQVESDRAFERGIEMDAAEILDQPTCGFR
jgi:hypothetical protein